MPDAEQRATAFVLLDLGDKPAVSLRPANLDAPSLRAWRLEDEVADVRLSSGVNQLHMEVRARGIEYHFHGADGQGTTSSPWPAALTDEILEWVRTTAVEYWQLARILEEQTMDAAREYVSGMVLYVPDQDINRMDELDTLTVNVPAVDANGPWAGTGHAGTDHVDGPDHNFVLRWNPEHLTPDRAIAVAHTDPATGEIIAAAEPGTNFADVGVTEAEALAWFRVEYRNHLLAHEIQKAIVDAAIERMAGLTVEG